MKKLTLKIAARTILLLPSVALAAPATPPDEPSAPFDTAGDVVDVIDSVAGWFFTVFLALAVIFLIWAAFLYLTAAGSTDKVQNAKNALIYSIIAIVVALIAGAVTAVLEDVLGA